MIHIIEKISNDEKNPKHQKSQAERRRNDIFLKACQQVQALAFRLLVNTSNLYISRKREKLLVERLLSRFNSIETFDDFCGFIDEGKLIKACLKPDGEGLNPLVSFVSGFTYDTYKLDLIKNGAARARALVLMLENYEHNSASGTGGMFAEWAGTLSAEHIMPKVN